MNQSSSFALVLKALLPQVAIPSFFETVDAFLLDESRFQVDISNIILLLVMALANDLPRFLGLTLVGCAQPPPTLSVGQTTSLGQQTSY